MPANQITVRLSLAWWLIPYLRGVLAFAVLTGRQPDMGKVGRWINRGIRARVGSTRLERLLCAVLGHTWSGSDGIAGALDCRRCGKHEPAVQCRRGQQPPLRTPGEQPRKP